MTATKYAVYVMPTISQPIILDVGDGVTRLSVALTVPEADALAVAISRAALQMAQANGWADFDHEEADAMPSGAA